METAGRLCRLEIDRFEALLRLLGRGSPGTEGRRQADLASARHAQDLDGPTL